MKCTVCCKPLPDKVLAKVLVGAVSPRVMTCSAKCSEARAADARRRAAKVGEPAFSSPAMSSSVSQGTPKFIRRRPTRTTSRTPPRSLALSLSPSLSSTPSPSAALKASAMAAKEKLAALHASEETMRALQKKEEKDAAVTKKKTPAPPPPRPKRRATNADARRPAPPPPRPSFKTEAAKKKTETEIKTKTKPGADAGAGNIQSPLIMEAQKDGITAGLLDETCVKELNVEELRSVELWAKDHQEKLEEMRSVVNRAIENAVTDCDGGGKVDALALEKALKGTVTRGITEIERRVLRHLATEQISGKKTEKKKSKKKKAGEAIMAAAAATAAATLLIIIALFFSRGSSSHPHALSGLPVASTIDTFNAAVDAELAGADAALRQHFANSESFPVVAQSRFLSIFLSSSTHSYETTSTHMISNQQPTFHPPRQSTHHSADLRDISEDRLGYLAKATVGVVGMALTGGLAAPYVGSMVGVHALGLAGSAATQGGLAALGGGAISAGGFGVAGGTGVTAAVSGLSTAGAFTLFRQVQVQPGTGHRTSSSSTTVEVEPEADTVSKETEAPSFSLARQCLTALREHSAADGKLAATPALDLFGTINYIIDGNSLYSDTLLYEGATGDDQPLYFGEFKRRAPHGRGCIFRPPTDPAACRIAYAGEFEAGDRHGLGTVFSPDAGCVAMYRGSFEGNLVAVIRDDPLEAQGGTEAEARAAD